MSEPNERLQKVVDQLLPRGRPLRVLEAGCGSASHIRLPEDRWLVGIDISQRQLDRHGALNERILGDLQVHEWRPGEFDLIVCWDVLEHLPSPAEAIERMFAAMNSGGLLVLALPNRYSLKGWVTRLTPFSIHVWFYRYIIGDKRAPDELDQFPTHFCAAVAPARIRSRARAVGLTTEFYFLYEGPVQTHLRSRSLIARLAFSAVGAISTVLTGGYYNANHSDCMIVLRRPPTDPQCGDRTT